MSGSPPDRSEPIASSSSSQQNRQQQLPFTNDAVDQSDFSELEAGTSRANDAPSSTQPRSSTLGTNLSSSYSKTPARSFFHHASHGSLDRAHYASDGVRDRTQQLASMALEDSNSFRSGAPIPRRYAASDSDVTLASHIDSSPRDRSTNEPRQSSESYLRDDVIEEVSEPVSPEEENLIPAARDMPRGSLISHLIRTSPPKGSEDNIIRTEPEYNHARGRRDVPEVVVGDGALEADETAALLPKTHPADQDKKRQYGSTGETGADGISMFFVSCIISQLTYSCGLSVFAGGVGSEMIEVVPFFHKMTYLIMGQMGDADPKAIMATVILSYAMSSVLTGIIFFVLGFFKLGRLVSFFPHSILLGAIGGVGFFLFVTGIEVSARLPGNLEYNMATLRELFRSNTVTLWVLPLVLAIILFALQRFFKNPFVMPAYFVFITAVFYFFVAVIPSLNLELLRAKGWVFEKPPSGVPFYRFYSYYNFGLTDWNAIVRCIPTMFALSFFGIIHVPINVPALGLQAEEDNVDINRELIAHGFSNTLSGFAGSIQNYLVYANSALFINNGGNSRWAGIQLAIATFAVWLAGPGMIGYIPVLVVGTLIYYLGIDLLQEALWTTFGTLQWLEYFTIVAVVLIMGIYDFVVGVVTGIVLACLVYVIQTSRAPAIRATYDGRVAESTVRRHLVQRRYLHEAGRQIYVVKLAGYLFFGSIVSVETKVRALIDDEEFKKSPIRYFVIDLSHVDGLDFSAAGAFKTMQRLLRRRKIEMLLSGVTLSDDVGKSLTRAGILDEEAADQKNPPPKVFENLNKALEYCENALLTAFIQRTKSLTQPEQSKSMAVPRPSAPSHPSEGSFNSPRRHLLHEATNTALTDHKNTTVDEHNIISPSKWKHFAQPVLLMLQTFQDLTDKNEDFWHRAAPFFQKKEFPAGVLRAEYQLEQGTYYESIMPGTTCGELPFFSETDRTGTVAAETDCVAWLLTREKWKELEQKQPDVASELLRISLKLTSERMSAITSYVLVTAS
ncbi:hypothetical protein H2199_001789 [Coniosporium tulheliwenetii]|uniref:Uncharacterized protein n=1 Tax=Coniosporium tulheliwenetii TaxID=3383036 RepID=A0ACC2ZKD6_9PEZI|nr:hypothetical protein H2199_001789 [Cladosporium sp. JES 115]